MKQIHSKKISDAKIVEVYNQGLNLTQAAALLNMTTVTLWRRSKFIGLSWRALNNVGKRTSLSDILEGKHPEYQTFKLKNKLLKANIKTNVCEVCGISEWNGMHINMQLDHIDGNSHNHLLENLRMICPNCHSQTNTYCGKNIK
jgi:RNA polymerase subunit RPABC4/transcription elongation factor Spt4